MNKTTSAIALAWLTEEDYPAHRALDPKGLPASRYTWQSKSEHISQEVAHRTGVSVIRVPINPDALAEWCRAGKRNIDSDARATYAAFLLAQQGRH